VLLLCFHTDIAALFRLPVPTLLMSGEREHVSSGPGRRQYMLRRSRMTAMLLLSSDLVRTWGHGRQHLLREQRHRIKCRLLRSTHSAIGLHRVSLQGRVTPRWSLLYFATAVRLRYLPAGSV